MYLRTLKIQNFVSRNKAAHVRDLLSVTMLIIYRGVVYFIPLDKFLVFGCV